MSAGPRQYQDQMVSRPRGVPGSAPGIAAIPPGPPQAGHPEFCIIIPDAGGHVLLTMREEHGLLVVEGDESRWDEGAKRFLHQMMQWSGQAGIRWKDEAARTAE
jgi:hypothetical protein